MNQDLTKQNDNARGRDTRREEQPQALAVRPRVDVFENEHEYLVVADLPGVTKDDLDLRFEDGELRLEARRAPREPAEGRPLAEEYRIADYRRAFAMPDGIEAEKIDATLSNGVLEVHLPKSAAKRPRRIDIRAS